MILCFPTVLCLTHAESLRFLERPFEFTKKKKREEKDQPEANTGGVNAKLSLSDYFTFSSMQRPLQTNPYLRVGLGPLVEIYRVENIYYL